MQAFDIDDERHRYVAAFAVIAGCGLWIAVDDDGWLSIIDSANLTFHEAGHMIYGLLGQTLGLYGGTLGQLTIPALALGMFAYRRNWPGAAIALAWLGENCFNIARYMADARAQLLPLVGGGEHDWWHIFTRWNVLAHDTRVAATTRTLGWMMIGAALGLIVWQFRRLAEYHARLIASERAVIERTQAAAKARRAQPQATGTRTDGYHARDARLTATPAPGDDRPRSLAANQASPAVTTASVFDDVAATPEAAASHTSAAGFVSCDEGDELTLA